jgi:alkanesulfonate monooxygenase SsuD/methylene tetrahydromethanopterin reductase-like flavin-dependent oxidoreductase (luciferase family)
MRTGLVLGGRVAPTSVVQAGARAEAAGLASFWVTEGISGDAFALLGAVATSTSRILLGTAIVSVFTRSLPLIGMATATLGDLSAGRFVLGLGISHREQVEGEHGLGFIAPRARLEDAVVVVRSILRDGALEDLHLRTTHVARFHLGFEPPRIRVPIYAAAVGPKMVELAWTIADGALLIWRTAAEVRALPPKHHAEQSLACIVHCAIGDSTAECERALAIARDQYAARFRRYRKLFEEQQSYAGVRCIGVESLAAHIDEYERAGVDELLLLPLPADGVSAEQATHRLLELASAASRATGCQPRTGGRL